MTTNGGIGGGSNKDKEKEKISLSNAAKKAKDKSFMSESEPNGRPAQTVYTPPTRSLISNGDGGSARDTPIGMTVNQTPGAANGSENTTITGTPRSDFSVVLAGQVGKRADRAPSRSNNFVSLIGGAGGLGRRSAESKRTLIGGA